MEELRLQAQRLFLNAASTGRLAAALKEAQEGRQREEMDTVRLQARSALLKAVANGSLAESLKQVSSFATPVFVHYPISPPKQKYKNKKRNNKTK